MLTLLNPKHFPYFSQSAPPGVSWGQFVQPVSIPRFTCIICENWIPIGPAVLPHFPGLWIGDPLNHPPPIPPWGIVGRTCVHSQMNPQTCTEYGANRSIRLAAFSDFNLWPPKTPRNAPYDIEGRIVFSLCRFPNESADLYQIWCQSVQTFDCFPKHLNCDPLNPLSEMPLGYCGANCI